MYIFFQIIRLVSKAEKSLTDHTEFIAAKEKVEEWLNRAHGTVQDCIGEGDLGWVKDKLQTVNLVSSRITEGTRSILLNLILLFHLLLNYLGSNTLILNFHLTQYPTSPSITFNHLLFDLPTFIFIIIFTFSDFSVLMTCANHLSIFSLTLSIIEAMSMIPLIR